MRSTLLCLFLLQAVALSAQRLEQGFDYAFKPTTIAPRYYVVTEKKDTLWQRQAWYLPERGLAMQGWYKDADCKVAHDTLVWYHPNKVLKSIGVYNSGKKEGLWLAFDEKGNMLDSATYTGGRLTGTRLRWNSEGNMIDSSQFDGAGNGVQVQWYSDGAPYAAGRWVRDTVKNGRWKYYHSNGAVMGTEDYAEGKRTACTCYDKEGKPLAMECKEEVEASFPGGDGAWRRFLERNLEPAVPVRMGAPAGTYTVVVQFIVDTTGKVGDIKALTTHGFGMEGEVMRMMKKSPPWVPALKFCGAVKAYRKQPVTFVVSQGQ